ncbi:STAS domain-containing protein [Hymenobacter metallicola]|uniref:STAS domain-containing protein n=1 Tax=Hymenobacter metallicola TaxID=2563114 RepID=A0A4Z0QD31_9BACT|nr:STAS domain-containing protein [Hymenobacter metallicola]TGE27083.1 STAS domain-containing protein [Hymenobacter metallicola]
MEVYREILPESYLLILADDVPTSPDHEDDALDRALSRAARSGKSSVWVDCSHLHHLPSDSAELLTYYYHKLSKHGMSLVLCHLNDTVRQELTVLTPSLNLPIVPTLLDAEKYCQQHVNLRSSQSDAA